MDQSFIAAAFAIDAGQPQTSLRVFRKYIRRTQTEHGEVLDASGVISKECFNHWASSRKRTMNCMEKGFQRSLSAHLTASDGRSPFTPAEEFAILKVIRKKQRWPCFSDTETRYGAMGFRSKGYHEKRWEESHNGMRWNPELDGGNGVDSPPSNDDDAAAAATTPTKTREKTATTSLVASASAAASMLPASASHTLNNLALVFLSMASQLLIMCHHHLPSKSGCPFDTTMREGAWSTVLSLGRMHLLSQAWSPPPSLEEAEAVLSAHLNAYHPQSLIAVCDLTCSNMGGRVLAMSPQARMVFGNVCRHEDGLRAELIPLEMDKWKVLNAIVNAVREPKQEHEVSVRLDANINSPSLQDCTLFLRAFPQERVLVVRALLL